MGSTNLSKIKLRGSDYKFPQSTVTSVVTKKGVEVKIANQQGNILLQFESIFIGGF
jgi:beta-lactamase superfamily II metal-dependent hydrolase